MRPSLWLIIPAFRRYDITRISLPQLRWACDELGRRHAIDATAVVIADDRNLDIAHEHGFARLEKPNQPLGKKWNDGYEFACKNGADYVVPCGTDDWLDPDYLAQLPGARTVRASRESTTVREDGKKLAAIRVDYDGGDGIRIIPTDMLKGCNYRPADDAKERAIDTSIWMTLNRTQRGYEFVYARDPLNIVQFQSRAPQLNTYSMLVKRFEHAEHDNPWEILAGRYPQRFVDAARELYQART